MVKKYSDRELIEELQALSKESEGSPGMKDMNREGIFSASTYQRRFGSWNESLRRAGLKPTRNLTEDDLVEELIRLKHELGSIPTFRDMNSHGNYSGSAYHKKFGSWNNALREAGLSINQKKGITREEMLEDLRKVNEELDGAVTFRSYDSFGRYSPKLYQQGFGSWNEALKEAGLVPNYGGGEVVPRGYLEEEFERVVDEVGRVPTQVEMSKFGGPSAGTYIRRFGSWREAISEFGYEPRYPEDWVPSGQDNANWEGGYVYNYGPSWEEARKKVRERDDYECRVCGISEEESLKDYGRRMDVHHIIPFREFGTENHCEANELSNLILLCRSCHRKVEIGEIKCPLPNNQFEEEVGSIRCW